jgi:hypothetical protein
MIKAVLPSSISSYSETSQLRGSVISKSCLLLHLQVQHVRFGRLHGSFLGVHVRAGLIVFLLADHLFGEQFRPKSLQKPVKRLASSEGFNRWITKSRKTLIEY